MLVFMGCKDENYEPPKSSTFIQSTINGIVYKSVEQLKLDSNSRYTQAVSFGTSYYSSSMYKERPGPFAHEYRVAQFRIASIGDTMQYLILICSANPISTQTYNIYSRAKIPYPTDGFAIFLYSSLSGVSDSAITGSITITKMDTINKQASGVFNVKDIKQKGSIPSQVIISDGLFTDLPIQQYY